MAISVETLLWEQVSGSTYVDHGQTMVTIVGHVVVVLAIVGESTIHRSKTLIIERGIWLPCNFVLFNIRHWFSALSCSCARERV